MHFAKIPTNQRAARANRLLERGVNSAVRSLDRVLGKLGIGGSHAAYDDSHYEFRGGPGDTLRKKHYDKSLRLLWKAEKKLPWTSFQDATKSERSANAEDALKGMAEQALSDSEKAALSRLETAEFRALLDREYSPAEKRALVAVLSAIGHGEAYAWLVSASMLPEVKSTGAKAAVTMQVLEEAKHFVVLRELVQAFGVEVPRLSAWEYVLLEGTLRARGLDRFFGMNVLVETIALSIFGLLADKPGLEVLRLFHLDESRHTALPANYFKEFPLSRWGQRNPVARMSRLLMALPAIPLVFFLEAELAELGIDGFDFGGSVVRKIMHLAKRAGFDMPVANEDLLRLFNAIFNAYCKMTRPNHEWRDFMSAETTRGSQESAVEKDMFGATSPG